ncbi:hypothetical protein LSUB1_G000819 [Lachnellula subtilissima]|uniref:Cell cycle control protein n=1 Tax=Lachnellula subtilissima TaxID=602034 RepID=A0A8H8S049_9HELO|nr:hypothetical protein LSUB1_G000819 [Lachnellula subtilissima]
MSRQSTLSPSPILFRDTPSFAARLASAAPNDNLTRNISPSFLERRRTSHPHNQSLQPSRTASQDMADVSQAQRPRLEHRASQTIIDLTDESEEPLLLRPHSHHRERSRSQRPPQLGRSDASGLMEFIDLTEDNGEPDIIITGGRELPRPQAARSARAPPHYHLPRPDSPSLFVPREVAREASAQPAIHRVFGRINAAASAGANVVGAALGYAMPARQPGARPAHHHEAFHFHPADDFLGQIHMMNAMGAMPQAMPRMDYRHPAFAERKAEHVPPKPARKDFTRSPTEDMDIICPSCMDELVHNKEHEEPVTKKNGKAPTKKEREEHPFWVVKECGHVYCNRCFQNRDPRNKVSGVSFDEITKPSNNKSKPSKLLLCAVEDCESDVKSKDKWIGVFL